MVREYTYRSKSQSLEIIISTQGVKVTDPDQRVAILICNNRYMSFILFVKLQFI